MSRLARSARIVPAVHPMLAAVLLGAAWALPATAVRAEGVQLTTDVGTLGLGAGLGTMFTESIGARVGFNAFRYSRNGTYSNNDYTGKLKFSSLDLLADWYAIGNFRLTAGFVHNANKVVLEATNATLNLNGQTYAIQSADAQIDLGRSRTTPYIGMGFGSKPRAGGGLGFHFDVGLLKQDPTATINVVLDPATQAQLNASPSLNATYQANKAQEEQKLRDSISGARNWPVVNLGVTYAF